MFLCELWGGDIQNCAAAAARSAAKTNQGLTATALAVCAPRSLFAFSCLRLVACGFGADASPNSIRAAGSSSRRVRAGRVGRRPPRRAVPVGGGAPAPPHLCRATAREPFCRCAVAGCSAPRMFSPGNSSPRSRAEAASPPPSPPVLRCGASPRCANSRNASGFRTLQLCRFQVSIA
jgi:hypothetical protein